MTTTTPPKNATPAVYEQPLGDERKYLKPLAVRYPGTIYFDAGCGHVVHDLVARLPAIPELDKYKTKLCDIIAEMVYPLAACLFAKSVSLSLIARSEPMPPPQVVSGLATYTVFDIQNNVMRHCFLSDVENIDYTSALSLTAGLAVLCEPLDYTWHMFHDDTRDIVNKADNNPILRWTERAVRSFYNLKGKSFVPVRLKIQATGITEAQGLGIIETAAMATLGSTAMATAGLLGQKSAAMPVGPAGFIHEAGLVETAARQRVETGKPKEAPRTAPAQMPDSKPTDFRTPQNPSQLATDPRTGRVLPAGITNVNTAIPLDPVTGKLLPVGVTDPRAVVNKTDEPQPKDAHDHIHHHGPDPKPDVN